MKKHLAILFLAAGMLLGGAQQGQAVDFKAKGVWINMLEYGGGGNFVKNDRNGHNVTGWGRWGEDEFEAKTRVRLQLEAIASESLSGTVYFEIGAATWGSASKGGALGADKNIVKIKHSYLDWVVPGTAVKARMGIQRIFLPDYASEASQVFDADVAGINVSAPLGEHAAVTAFWAGLTGEITAADPFRLAWSVNYGTFDSGEEALNRSGWYASLLAEYKLDWGTPGIYAWYSSGDDDDPTNGSERLPSFDYNNECTSGFSGFGTLGTWTIGRDAVLGYTLAGTWGFGARIRDLSFIDKLSHTIRVNFYNGTNAPRMARYIKGELDVPGHAGRSLYGTASDFNNVNTNGGIYLTQRDYAAEFGIMSSYQIYDNLRLLVEANYIALWLDQSSDVWGGFSKNGSWHRANSIEDAWNVNMSFIYKF